MKIIAFFSVWLLIMGLTASAGASGDEKNHETGIPKKYASMENGYWADPNAIVSGKKIYQGKCSACHGINGDGKGPVASAATIKPADFTDKDMIATMSDGYWFWRVAKGGAFPPFNSIMPSFEKDLTEEEIWQVIAYEHTFSHKGLHVHKELQGDTPHKHHEHHEDEE